MSTKKSKLELMANGSSSIPPTTDNEEFYETYTYKPSLTKVFFRTFGAYYMSANFLKFFHDCLLLLSPYVLKYAQNYSSFTIF